MRPVTTTTVLLVLTVLTIAGCGRSDPPAPAPKGPSYHDALATYNAELATLQALEAEKEAITEEQIREECGYEYDFDKEISKEFLPQVKEMHKAQIWAIDIKINQQRERVRRAEDAKMKAEIRENPGTNIYSPLPIRTPG